MLERAIEIKAAYQATLQGKEDLRQLLLSEKDWIVLADLLQFLQPIKEATFMISKEKVPNVASATIIYQYLFTHFDKAKQSTSRWLVEIAKVAHAKLEKYYPDTDGKAYVIGTSGFLYKTLCYHRIDFFFNRKTNNDFFLVLHPSFKLQWYKQAGWPESWISNYSKIIQQEWQVKYRNSATAGGESQLSGSDDGDFFSRLYKQQMGSAAKAAVDELAKYLAEAIVPTEHLKAPGLLGWWKVKFLQKLYITIFFHN